MPDIVALGPLRLDGLLLTVLLCAAAGFIALRLWRRVRAKQDSEGPWEELLFNAAVIVAIAWKLGFLLSQPSLLWERPMSLLLMRGRFMDVLLGLLLAAIYLLYVIYSRKLRLLALLDTLPFALLPGLMLWNALTALPYRLPYAFALLILYLLLLRAARDYAIGDSRALRFYLLGIGFGGLIVSMFTPAEPGSWPHLVAGLTGMQWVFVLHALVAALLASPIVERAARE